MFLLVEHQRADAENAMRPTSYIYDAIIRIVSAHRTREEAEPLCQKLNMEAIQYYGVREYMNGVLLGNLLGSAQGRALLDAFSIQYAPNEARSVVRDYTLRELTLRAVIETRNYTDAQFQAMGDFLSFYSIVEAPLVLNSNTVEFKP